MRVAFALLLASFAPSARAGDAAVASLVLLSQAAAEKGAVCLDGSPSAYYIYRPPVPSSSWIVHQNGGGWCSSPVQCAQRANTTLGSSRFFTSTTPLVDSPYVDAEDYFSLNKTLNPLMAAWNIIDLMYCDGSSQASDVEAPVQVAGYAPIFYRGARVLTASIESALAAGLSSATDVVISGCSAGGLSVYLHIDKWAAAIHAAQPSARVVGLADSGFFVDYNASGSALTFPERMQWTYENGNISGALSAACLARFSVEEGWKCFMAENAVLEVKTPVFALQSYYDSYQILAIAQVNASSIAAVNAYGAVLSARLASAQAANRLFGGAIDACSHHCSRTLWHAMRLLPGTANATESSAFSDFYAAPRGQVSRQDAAYPCPECCKGGF